MTQEFYAVPGLPHFTIQELVPKVVFEQFKSDHLFLLNFLDKNALASLYAVRKAFGSTTVNNWHINPDGNQYRGYRQYDCPIGAKRSQHKLGKAFDCSFKGVTAEEARQYILANPHKFPHITAMENSVPWLHFDVRFAMAPGITLFKP